ncbi:hypothetical protein B0H19DRAFT_1092738 [Mycena capillaripes]|nr:hypothetical protein B0H19DRAFT_1092738 [Mycena capillaripes]
MVPTRRRARDESSQRRSVLQILYPRPSLPPCFPGVEPDAPPPYSRFDPALRQWQFPDRHRRDRSQSGDERPAPLVFW